MRATPFASLTEAGPEGLVAMGLNLMNLKLADRSGWLDPNAMVIAGQPALPYVVDAC